ncbi:hypothetical protein RUM43_014519 [Polyplax serrata]|uniref:Uncharacterized protein n=1 Tax=Polyplax serrata TaxID=468196 RepID=A0AAN8P0Z3_POLSC
MSFCRITGKSRGLPKPNYFPLLPPISPADAKRLCRITNKSKGLPKHHYIPALSGARGGKANCRVTAKSEGQAPHHYPTQDGLLKPHIVIPGYKYVFPNFDEDHKLQKQLLALMSTKAGNVSSNVRYVYCVEEKKTNLVIPAGLEAAVRDGEVRDVLLGQEGDTILIKMIQGPSVTVDVNDFVLTDEIVLWEGMGPKESVLMERMNEDMESHEKRKKRLQAINDRKKIFEDRERRYDEEELKVDNDEKARKTKMNMLKLMKKEEEEKIKKKDGQNFMHLKEKLLSNSENCEPIFGHIVQTSTSVTFYPGASVVDLPEGKTIPGRMEKHGDTVKFVPGMIIDDKFIAGQIVTTDNGEEFVPGHVIETSEGPKFVPGQMVDTIAGPKFVPGQTILTDNGYQFVPGQIIDTKAGPTFIPGQIIVTDQTAKFVPGRVIETSEGPRFVPGRVIETGDQVTFVSGQVVDTPEGLKFVAPDLENDDDGIQEFSVQGFEVTPEELKLLRPAASQVASDTAVAIDSEVLKQLSQAGMSIGRQLSNDLPKVDIRLLPVTSERLHLSGEEAVKMAQVILSLALIGLKVARKDDSCTCDIDVNDAGVQVLEAVAQSKNLEKYLRVIVASAVVACRKEKAVTEEALMVAISLAIEKTLGEAVDQVSPEKVVTVLHDFLASPENFNQIIIETVTYLELNETLGDKIEFVKDCTSEPSKVINKISKILNGNMAEAFSTLVTKDPTLLKGVVEHLNQTTEIRMSAMELQEILEKAIVSVVKERSEQKIMEMIRKPETKTQSEMKEFQNLLRQSVGLAKALGMWNVARTLMEVISDPSSHEILSKDATVMNILERLTIMREIAEGKPELAEALGRLATDPEAAKADPQMRELVRRSTALMVVPHKNLQSSADIPISLLMSCNNLALENYFTETKRPNILLILKSGIQAVVPREAARAVLTGQVPYAVVDEKGIKYFEPLHVFSAMRLPKYAAKCFTMYCCPEVDASHLRDAARNPANDFKLIKTIEKP